MKASLFGLGKEEGRLATIPIYKIVPNPYQPREVFDDDALRELSLSISRHGVLQPLTVRKLRGGQYELIAGERRLRASRIAGLESVPCIVIRATEEESSLLAMIENLQRSDLDFFEEAMGYARLIRNFGLTQDAVAQRVGRSQSVIANRLRLLKLDDRIIAKIRQYKLTERHARALLRIEDNELRMEVLDEIIENHLNVQKTEQYIDGILIEHESKTKAANLKPLIKDVRFFFNSVHKAVEIVKRSGIEAVYGQVEMEDAYKVTIVIPKKSDSSTPPAAAG